jgi:inosine/xanthosine triphosphatase
MTVIHVGSKNQTKIKATQNILGTNDLFKDAIITGVDVEVEEFGHPKSLSETIHGAKDRARAAFEGSDLAVGLESGLLEAPETKTGYLETTVCALYDGRQYAIGMAPSFEWPKKVTTLILSGLDGSQAFKKVGLTNHEKLGTAEGAVHTLTHGATNRTRLNELAIMMALIQLQNPEHY